MMSHFLALNRNNVEPADGFAFENICHVMSGRLPEPLLFLGGNALLRALPTCRLSLTNFNKHKCFAVHCDDVNLRGPRVIISGDDGVAESFDETSRAVFGVCA
jgi:hypothetical protein